MSAWKRDEIANNKMPTRHMREFLKEVVRAAEAENFHVN